MSSPQHIGDLILPSHSGHLDTCTFEPSASSIMPFSRGISQLPQVALTAIPH
ncbi:hypothetical protein N9H82_06100 [Flavobacteriaceae bacterium]|nr:hypothetical protein [Flavobacteriaceae bacterium]